ncbi:MAG TPA: sulfatase [Candidatus Polarisedimenticolia bacterium]|nr:sulfatase [Candidatus Polarisedimenticolia bacterium]
MSATRSAPRRCGVRAARRAWSRSVVFAALVAALVVPCACFSPRLDPNRQDIVLIVVDTLRADHLGIYGYPRSTSPHLDALGRGGVVFERAWGAAPWTLPSIMSIMTSRYPSSHRVENDGLRLPEGIPTLAETLHAEGYATGGFVSHVYVTAPFGFARGFDTFEDFGLSRPEYRLEAGLEPTADRVTDAALAWLKPQASRSLFLFVHYFDPHWPYDPPPAYRDLFPSAYRGPLDASHDALSKFQDPLTPIPEDYRRFLIDRYDGEIRFVDDQVGRLLDGLREAGRGERAWIIVTADHGEEFKDHGSMGHGRALYEETIRVPLLIGRLSGAATHGARRTATTAGGAAGAPGDQGADDGRGARVATPVSGIDLFPTIAALAGVANLPPGLQGKSLAPPLSSGAPRSSGSEWSGPPPDRTLVSETVRLNACRKAVRSGRLKLIQFMDENRSELYDLVDDPHESHDQAPERTEDRHRLMRLLYSEVDLLSGGWNLRWSGGGRSHRFHGRIGTTGIFRSLVPLFPGQGKYVVEQGNTLEFTDPGQTGASGLSFTTAPYEARVTFQLTIDGRAMPERIFLGGRAVAPEALPFTLEGDAQAPAAFIRPPRSAGNELGFFLWRTRPAGPDQTIILDDEIRERLRSLGYVN